VFLIGDPGQGKTVLMRYAARLSPRGYYVNAKTTSVAGLVGGAEKMNMGLGGETWTYVGGICTMADRGLVAYDEADKAKDNDAAHAFLEPLEQQTVTMTKMGVRGFQVPARLAAIIGANPKEGRFDWNAESIADQITLPAPFLDRMDLIFVLDDEVDEKRDRALVNRILDTQVLGGIMARRRAGHDAAPVGVHVDDAMESELRPPISIEMLRKFIAYARREILPVLSDDARARVAEHFITVRKRRSDPNGPIGMTARQTEALTRIAEAAARSRLSDLVEDDDVSLAFDVWKAGYEKLATNKRGQLDADRLGSTLSLDQRELMKEVKRAYDTLTPPNGDGGPSDDSVIASLVARGVDRDRVLAAIQHLKQNGSLVQVRGGWITATWSSQRARGSR
jgi:replicative DNA helicase Mcm